MHMVILVVIQQVAKQVVRPRRYTLGKQTTRTISLLYFSVLFWFVKQLMCRFFSWRSTI